MEYVGFWFCTYHLRPDLCGLRPPILKVVRIRAGSANVVRGMLLLLHYPAHLYRHLSTLANFRLGPYLTIDQSCDWSAGNNDALARMFLSINSAWTGERISWNPSLKTEYSIQRDSHLQRSHALISIGGAIQQFYVKSLGPQRSGCIDDILDSLERISGCCKSGNNV